MSYVLKYPHTHLQYLPVHGELLVTRVPFLIASITTNTTPSCRADNIGCLNLTMDSTVIGR